MKPGVNESQEDKAAIIELVDSKFKNQQNSIHFAVTKALFNVNTAKAQAIAEVSATVFLKRRADNKENDATLQNREALKKNGAWRKVSTERMV